MRDECRDWAGGEAESIVDVAVEEAELDGQVGGKDVLVFQQRCDRAPGGLQGGGRIGAE
jgi:hypothetical protein